MKRSRFLLALPLLLTFSQPLVSQTQSALPGIFGEVLEVRVVNIEVVVTDKKTGLPVLGLGPEDFTLEVDGEQVPIGYFTEVRGGTTLSGVGEELVPGIPAVAPGKPVGTSYLLFIDDFFSIHIDRNRVLNALAEDLPLLGPEDRMAVVAFAGQELEMLSTWSQSVDRLERVLRDARGRPAKGLQRLVEFNQFDFSREVLDDLVFDNGLGVPEFTRTLSIEERAYVERLSDQINRSVAAVSSTMRSFAQPPGRKVLILLSGGWPFMPADYLVGDISRLVVDRQGPFGDNLYRRLVETANLIGYTIYPVDVPGLSRSLNDATSAQRDAPGRIGDAFFQEQQIHQTLEFIARETGGEALINSRRVEAFSSTVADTRSYYWLGFAPSREWDDKRHDIRVKVGDRQFRVRSRTGYLDTSQRSEVNMAVESALLFGNAPGYGSLDASAGAAVATKRNRMEVPLEVSIPLDQVTFLPVDDRWASELELRIAIVDESGQQAEMPVIPLQLTAPEEPRAGSRGTWGTTLQLRKKGHRAVVAVYDPASGRILSAGLEISSGGVRRR